MNMDEADIAALVDQAKDALSLQSSSAPSSSVGAISQQETLAAHKLLAEQEVQRTSVVKRTITGYPKHHSCKDLPSLRQVSISDLIANHINSGRRYSPDLPIDLSDAR